MRGVCYCTGGRCAACGIAGESVCGPSSRPAGLPPAQPQQIVRHVHDNALTEDRVREIVREELNRAIELLKRSGGGVGGDIVY